MTCRNAECRYAECHYAEYHYAECHYTRGRYAEFCLLGQILGLGSCQHYWLLAHTVECHSANCHSYKRRGATDKQGPMKF